MEKSSELTAFLVCSPGSDRLEQLVCHMALHEGAEAEGGGYPLSFTQHLYRCIPGITEGTPHLRLLTVSVT